MYSALIRKDVRVNGVPLAMAAALVVLSYLAVAMMASFDPLAATRPWPQQVVALLFAGSLASHLSSQLSLAVVAGNLFAAERGDRSAEFLAYLPVSRWRVLLAKAAVLGGLGGGLLLLHLAGVQCAWALGGLPPDSGQEELLGAVATISAAGCCAAGVGWLGSCTLHSSAFAVLMAIAAPLVVALPINALVSAFGARHGLSELAAAWFVVGLCGFVWGTRHYVLRVEP